MPAYYPCSVWSPTTKTNKVDLVDADHINQGQLEIVAIQNQLQVGLDSDGSVRSGSSFPSPAKPSQQFWRTDLNILYIFTGSSWSPQSGISTYTAGSYLLYEDTGIYLTQSGSYTKVTEVYLPNAGTYTVKFYLQGGSGVGVLGRIYRNGSAVGTEQTQAAGAGGGSFSEDISGWSAGDLLQLYIHDGNGGTDARGGYLQLFVSAPTIVSRAVATYPISTAFYGNNAGIPTTNLTALGKIGDLFLADAGGASTTLYVKTGATTWTAK